MNRREGRLYGALIWACGGLFLSAGALLAILMLSNVIGPFRFQEPRAESVSRVVGFWLSANAQPEPGDRLDFETRRDLVPRGWTSTASDALENLEAANTTIYVLSRPRGIDANEAAALAPRIRDGASAVLISPRRPSRLAGDELRWANAETAAPAWRATLGRGRLAWLRLPGESPASLPQATLADGLEAQLAWAAREPTLEVRTRPSPLQARVLRAGPHRLRVQVTNRGDATLSGAVIRVHLNRPVRRVTSEATALGQSPTPLAFLPDGEQVDLLLPELAPYESQAYHLDLDEDTAATLDR